MAAAPHCMEPSRLYAPRALQWCVPLAQAGRQLLASVRACTAMQRVWRGRGVRVARRRDFERDAEAGLQQALLRRVGLSRHWRATALQASPTAPATGVRLRRTKPSPRPRPAPRCPPVLPMRPPCLSIAVRPRVPRPDLRAATLQRRLLSLEKLLQMQPHQFGVLPHDFDCRMIEGAR